MVTLDKYLQNFPFKSEFLPQENRMDIDVYNVFCTFTV